MLDHHWVFARDVACFADVFLDVIELDVAADPRFFYRFPFAGAEGLLAAFFVGLPVEVGRDGLLFFAEQGGEEGDGVAAFGAVDTGDVAEGGHDIVEVGGVVGDLAAGNSFGLGVCRT